MSATVACPGDDEVMCHIIPLWDFREHEASCGCWCHPQPAEGYPEVMVHRALDGRERYESGELRLQ